MKTYYVASTLRKNKSTRQSDPLFKTTRNNSFVKVIYCIGVV